MSEGPYSVTAGADDSGKRADKWLTDNLPLLSRSRLRSLMEEGRVSVNGAVLRDPASRVRPGWIALVDLPPARDAEPEAQAADLDILFEDDALLVVDKPAGMVVHPAPGNPDRTLVNALIAHCGDSLSGIGGVRRPGIVHRLDKDTSGLMVVAKTDLAHRTLATQFSDRSIERRYLALCWGLPAPAAGEVDAPVGRDPRSRVRMAVVAGGKPALTRYRVRAVDPEARFAAVECRLATGRTHQIRVHMAHLGHPLLGDSLYGRMTPARRRGLGPNQAESLAAFGRQALDAFALSFRHPVSGERLSFVRDPAPDLRDLVAALAPGIVTSIQDQSGRI